MISEKPWSLFEVVRLFLVILITYCLGMCAAGLVEKLTLSREQIDTLQLLIGVVSLQLSGLVWITVFVRQRAMGWVEAFGLRLSHPIKVCFYGLAVGFCFLPIAWGLQKVSTVALEAAGMKPEEQAVVQELQSPTLSMPEKVVFGLLTIAAAPLFEEALFRGILYPALKQQGYHRLAWWGTSTLFAAMHLNGPTFLPLMAFAMVLIFLYETFGNLLAPIAAHCIFNTANFMVLIFPDQINRFLHLQ